MKTIVVSWTDADFSDHELIFDVSKDFSASEIDRLMREKVWEDSVTNFNWYEKGKEDETN